MPHRYVTAKPGQWTGPAPVGPDELLELQVADTGPARDGWVLIESGWVYGPGDGDIAPSRGVRVRAAVLRQR